MSIVKSYGKPLKDLTWEQVLVEYTAISMGTVSIFEIGEALDFLTSLVDMLYPIVTDEEWDLVRGAE